MQLQELGIVHRYRKNPVLSRKEVLYQAELIFNAGVCTFNGR